MADILENVNPTRMELLNIRKKTKLAEKGHKLLKEKRDALIMEFFEMVKQARQAREELNSSMQRAFASLVVAQSAMGRMNVKGASLAVRQKSKLDTKTRNIMGVLVPKLEYNAEKQNLLERGYGLASTSASFDQSVLAFQEAIQKITQVAEIESSLNRLADEIQKTKRRVNALEYLMIPKLTNTEKYIGMRLSEMERENFFRLKTIKRVLENAS